MQDKLNSKHGIVMHGCASLSISGVNDVDRFNEKQILLFTECGELSVYGEGLHINEMSVETGDVSIEGEISALIYGDKSSGKRSILGKLFR